MLHEVGYATQATGDALWFFVNYENQASFKIFKVKRESQADLRIFKVAHAEQAGWRTLVHALKARGLQRGLATLCIGGGEATAMAVELI